jgi:spore coat protein A
VRRVGEVRYHRAVPFTEAPALGSTEIWGMHNFTEDAHPIHIHQVQFQVVNREDMRTGSVFPPEPLGDGVRTW